MKKKNILFFARGNQTTLFPKLKSEAYNSFYVSLTKKDKKYLLNNNEEVVFCFEEYLNSYDFNALSLCKDELITSFYSDRFWSRYNIVIRNKLLALEFKFWNEVLDYYKPYAVINEVIAVEHAEVLFIEAEKRNIKYWAWLNSPFKNRQFYWLDTPFNSTMADNVFKNKLTREALNSSKDYILKLNNNYSKPFYLNEKRNWISFKNFTIIISKYFITLFRYLLNKNRINKYIQDYYYGYAYSDLISAKSKLTTFLRYFIYKKSYSFPDNSNFNYVIFPIHYEPEATLSYFSEYYQEQEYLISNIAKTLRNNQILLVKEHPEQPGALLNKKFRTILKRTSNVFFIKAEYPTKELILKADLVITIASTMGWEALMLNKKVVVFGNVFYDKHPSIIKFDGDWTALKEAIRNKDHTKPSFDENVKFVASFWSYCEEGYPLIHKERDTNENIEKIKLSIEKKVLKND
jgi:hypothetical protein